MLLIYYIKLRNSVAYLACVDPNREIIISTGISLSTILLAYLQVQGHFINTKLCQDNASSMNENIFMMYKTPCHDFTFTSGFQLATYSTVSFRLYTKTQAKEKYYPEINNEFEELFGNHYFERYNTWSAERTKIEMPS